MKEVIPRITEMSVSWISPKSLLVKWEVERIPEDWGLYTIDVLRGYGKGNFYNISGTQSDIFEFLDDRVKQLHPFREIGYKVKISSPDGVVSEYGPAHLRNLPDLTARDIIRRNNLILERKVGKKSKVYRIRTIGERCERCWDHIKKRSDNPNCPDCLGTGFSHGFYDPIDTYINFSPSDEIVKLSPFGEVTENQITAWMSNYPYVNPRDVIVDEDRRWRIIDRKQTEKRGVMIHQIIRLEKINQNDIEYRMLSGG